MSSIKDISIVVPVLNEEDSIRLLYDKINHNLINQNKEIIFVNDGSSDGSRKIILDIVQSDKSVKMIDFKKNYGKAVALSEAFKICSGRIVVTIDSDLQDDPCEIKRLISKIDEGWDLVSGWKKIRNDSFSKVIASKVFNLVTRLKTGIKIHDFNCGLKAYKLQVVKSIKLYGHLHRFIPVLAFNQGYKVTEIVVKHHPRKYGKTKYGKSRFFHGLYDFLTVIFLDKYIDRPMHFFGRFGLFFYTLGFLISIYLTVQWLYFYFGQSVYNQGFTIIRPLFFLGILFIIVGVQFFSIGFIGEIIVRKISSDARLNMNIISEED
ncbi:MAG: glycosyltransferase [Candidatus Marinimicrobia bacterium]|nr:glycosyltransferase [Candidatus Neomarinimicrobiota bacterium]